MADSGVEVSSTIPDLSNLGGMLFDVERKVLTRYRSRMLGFVRAKWTGWKYEDRPASAPRNVSFKAWKARVYVNTPSPELHITNAARDYRSKRPYVEYVARSRGQEEEWKKLSRALEAEFVPALARDLIAEVTKNLASPTARRPLRTREARPDTRVIASALVV